MNKNILSIGNALTDMLCVLDTDELINKIGVERGSMHVINAEQLGKIKDLIKGREVKMVRGGSAPNVLGGIAKLGSGTAFIGKIGKDSVGEFFANDLMVRGIKSEMIISSNEPSGTCIALISPDGERTFLTCLGAAASLEAKDLNEKMFEGFDICHVDGYLLQNYDLIESALYLAKKSGSLVSLDLASFNVVKDNLEFLKKITHDYVDILFANEEESKAFSGMEPEQAIEQMANMVDYAVVKLGGKGAMAKHDGILERFEPMKNIKCIDTTGAGDLFAGGFLYALANGKSLADCGRIGTLLSGNVIQVVGTKMADETWASIRSQI